MESTALDQREVDLDDVEAKLAEQPQARVPGADVVGGHADPGHPAGVDGAPQPTDVLDRLALGQLEDQVAGIQSVPIDHLEERVDAELVRLERSR